MMGFQEVFWLMSPKKDQVPPEPSSNQDTQVSDPYLFPVTHQF